MSGPGRLQLWRARHISAIRIEERQRRADARQQCAVNPGGDWLVRLATVLAVAGVAAYVSYWHTVDVVTRHGERAIIGHLYPVAIDGIIVAASMVLLDAARHAEPPPALAWLLLGAGILVTLAANVTYGIRAGIAGALWAAWPAAAFVGCYELLMLLVRAGARRAGPAPDGALPAALPNDAETAAMASMRATVRAGNPWSANQLVTRFGLSRAQAAKIRGEVAPEPSLNGDGPHA